MIPTDRESGRGDSEEGDFAAVPAYQSGGRVDRTGIALVHQGEYIVPAPGSEALITEGGSVVHFHFPVEVELIGELSEPQMRALAERVYREINDALGSRR